MRRHFCASTARTYGRRSLTRKICLNCTMPALTKSRLGSSSGTSEALGTTVWPRSRKNSRKLWRISSPVTTARFYRLGSGAATTSSSLEQARRPPRVELGHVRARPEREARPPLLEERGHALPGVGPAPHPVDGSRGDLLPPPRMVGAQPAPEGP